MSLNELAKEAHQIAVEHGWWDKEPTFGELVALMHSELSEALEEYRAGRPMVWYRCGHDGADCLSPKEQICYVPVTLGVTEDCMFHEEKPEGIAVELADCVIDILDWAGHEDADLDRVFVAVKADRLKWDLDKISHFGDFISGLHNILSMAYTDEEDNQGIYFCMVIDYIQEALKQSGVALYTVMRAKMEYNRTRPYRHGGKKL